MTPSAQPALSSEEFKRFTDGLDYPVFIVTTVAAGDRSGCLIGFSTQVSIEPPRLLVALSDKNHTYRVAREADLLAVHVVPSHDHELALLFGGETDDEVDKFTRCDWHEGPGGVPLLDECPRVVVGRILEQHPYGDHVGFVLEPIEVSSRSSEKGMGFAEVADVEPGHDP